MTEKIAQRLPGDPTGAERIHRMIRVDHAGEYGARRIYQGQLAILGQRADAAAIRHMAEQEDRHLAAFDRLIAEHRVRPTAFHPVWHMAGYALGAATALMGREAAMACTVAVEEVIDEHYKNQADELGSDEPQLRQMIEEFRGEEIEHRDIGLAEGAGRAPGYELLKGAIKAGSRLAIWLSERF
jgi:ubiquinone biosynthesis monooxygenase Coq7